VSSVPKTVTRQHRDCNLNPGPSAPESSTLTTRLPSHPIKTSRETAIVGLADVGERADAVLQVVLLLSGQPGTLRQTVGGLQQPHEHRLMGLRTQHSTQ